MPVVDKPTGIVCAVLFSVWGLLFAGVAWFVSEMACDEGCRDPAERMATNHWSHYADSWQWTVVFGLGLSALAAALLVVIAASLGSRRIATAAFALHVLGVFAATGLYDDGPGGPWLTGEMFLVFVAGLALGVGTIAGLTKPRAAPTTSAPAD